MLKVSKRINKLFCILLMLQLFLRSYGIPGIGGSLADLVLILIVVWIAINQKSIIYLKDTLLCFLPFFIYLFINFVVTWHTDLEAVDQIIDWFRSVMWYYILIFGVKKYFSSWYSYKIYEILAIVSTLFLIIQYVLATIFGSYISGFFTPLSLIDSSQMYSNFSMYSLSLYRPNSFFAEPAHYATFIVPYLCLNCLSEINFKTIGITVFITFGVLLSGSTTGLVMCVLCVAYWLFNFFRETKNLKYFFIILILVALAYSIISQMDSFQFMLYRTFGSTNASISRLRWYSEDTFPFNSIVDYLFGVGNCSDILQSRQGWLPGWAILLQNYGIIGFVIYLGGSISLFHNSNLKSKAIIVAFWLLGIGAEVIVDQHMFYFLPFAIVGVDELYLHQDKKTFSLKGER